MFTGIVEALGHVERNTQGMLVISRPREFSDATAGASISVAGVCLTVSALDADTLTFAVVPETLARTTLGGLQPGDRVNLERALAATGRFDGHVVQGHVEAVGEIAKLDRQGDDIRLSVVVPPALDRFVVPKGSIAIDGVSLTVAERLENLCVVALVPYTLAHTTLGDLVPGNRVNLETDMLVRAVEWIASSHAR